MIKDCDSPYDGRHEGAARLGQDRHFTGSVSQYHGGCAPLSSSRRLSGGRATAKIKGQQSGHIERARPTVAPPHSPSPVAYLPPRRSVWPSAGPGTLRGRSAGARQCLADSLTARRPAVRCAPTRSAAGLATRRPAHVTFAHLRCDAHGGGARHPTVVPPVGATSSIGAATAPAPLLGRAGRLRRLSRLWRLWPLEPRRCSCSGRIVGPNRAAGLADLGRSHDRVQNGCAF
jgi:hypothetical protein